MIFDFLLACYFSFRFLGKDKEPEQRRTIIFARGAFRRDIKDLGTTGDLIVINGELIRRIIRQAVPDAWLEQVVTLNYREQIRSKFPLTLKVFRSFVNKQPTRIVYGGVDYFEVSLFADRDFYTSDTMIDAIFHENYAIEYVANVNMAIYDGIASRFVFDNLYSYGPPATTILRKYTRSPAGPMPMVMPRLARMEDDKEFFERLSRLQGERFSHTVTLLAFPGSEYLASICFTSTLLYLTGLQERDDVNAIVKFKNRQSAAPYMRQFGKLGSRLSWKCDGSIEELAWISGFTIVFNSISLYEALLAPTMVLIPYFLDARHDPNLLQESPSSVPPLQSVRFVTSTDEITSLIDQYDTEQIKAMVAQERQARKALVARKFYLSESASSAQAAPSNAAELSDI